MKKDQKGFSAVEGLLILVIIGMVGFVGWYVWQAKSDTNKTLQTTTKDQSTSKVDPYAGWKTYEVKDLSLTFKYPSDWKIVDDSDNLDTLIRVQSPDFLRSADNTASGTQISVSTNGSHNTYSVDKQSAATDKQGTHKDVKDLAVDDKPAFSYTRSQDESGYTLFTVEVDLGTKGAREFLYQSNTKAIPQKYDITNIPVFNKLLQSVVFQ